MQLHQAVKMHWKLHDVVWVWVSVHVCACLRVCGFESTPSRKCSENGLLLNTKNNFVLIKKGLEFLK